MYAIMICIDGQDDWIYVTEDTGKCDMWNFIVQTFETFEQANQAATVWRTKGKEMNVKVVKYES